MMLFNGECGSGLTVGGKPRTCGFRLSLSDVLVLASSLIGSWLAWGVVREYSLFILFVVGHFFLFCNIFRVRRSQELAWSAIFLGNVALWLFLDGYSAAWLLSTQVLATLAVILIEANSPAYHGVFSRKINKNIDGYLSGE